MRQFEIPYNFDKTLISALYKLDSMGSKYHCIYCPPFWEDYISAKYNYIHANGLNMSNNKQMTRADYESHILYINLYFPGKLMLLLQQNKKCISESLLKYYYDLGFTKFCVGNIEQAKIIKCLFPEAEIIASITMKIQPEDLKKLEYSIFDSIVLWFPYNRNFNLIKHLPKNYKYILLVNCDCSIYCQGSHHWFASPQEEKQMHCPKKNSWSDIIRIEPQDLYLFEPYITYFKLQGREYSTTNLLKDIILYTTNFKYLNPNLNTDENKYQNEVFNE